MNLVAFSWILVGKMVLYPSKIILLLSSCIKSSVKMRGPVPAAAMHVHAMTPPSPCFTGEAVSLGSFAIPFFATFFISHHLDKDSYLSHLSINTVPKLFWVTFVLFCNSNLVFLILVLDRCLHLAVASVILCQNLLSAVDFQSITPAFWKLFVILRTRLLWFDCHQLLFSQPIRYLLFAGVAGWFPNSWFVHALCFCYSSNWLPIFF